MNASLLTRLFKTIYGDRDSSLMKVAYSIIIEEEKKGHIKLAEKLRNILVENSSSSTAGSSKSLNPIHTKPLQIPVDRRYQLPLATYVERDALRKHMVLAPQVEHKILRIEKEYLARERLLHHGLKPRKKILLYGAPGCGKTMAAERIAWDLGLPFYKVRFDTIISSYLGESAANLQKLFDSAAKLPCVLLLDEFDIIGKQRNGNANDVGEAHRIVNILLGLLEEYDGEGILIATTNLEKSLDSALFRRFDDFIELPKPTEAEIYILLKQILSALKLDNSVNLKQYSKKMVGMSYAIIVKIANDAAKKAVIHTSEEISIDDLDSALEENRALNK